MSKKTTRTAGKRRQFTSEYKAEVVRLAAQPGKTPYEVARELGLSPSTVRNWVKQAAVGGEAKRRSTSQRIGTKGERLFAAWTADVGLTANKTEEDFGIDFFCQVLSENDVVIGPILAVQVRSTDSFSHKRITLDRSDLTCAAQVETPFCLVGVDTQGRRIGFRFLDEDMLASFHEVLRSDRDSWSVRFKDLEHGSQLFRLRVTEVTKPGFQTRLRVLRAQETLESNFPGSRISVRHSATGGVAVVEVPWLTSVFQVDAGRREEILRHVLDEGNLPEIGMPGLKIRPGLEAAYRLSDAPGIFVGGPFEQPDQLCLVDANGELDVEAVNREMDGDFSVASASGLVIRFGQASLDADGQSQHRVSFHLSQKGRPLGDERDLEFLRRLKPEAKLRHGADYELELWDPITRIGSTIEALELICKTAGIELGRFKLASLHDPEFTLAVMVFDAIARGAELQTYFPGFVLGPAAANNIMPHHPSWYEVPVVANLGDVGVVAWCRGRCLASLHEDQICGMQPLTQSSVHWKVCERLPTGGRPEVWVADQWSAFDVLEPLAENDRAVEPAAHPLGGMIWLCPKGKDGCPQPKEWRTDGGPTQGASET